MSEVVYCEESFRPQLERWLRDGPAGEPVKQSGVRRIWRWEGTFVKQFRDGGLRDRARHELDNLRLLASKGVAVPQPLALAGGYLFTRELAGAQPLRDRIDALDPRELGRFVAGIVAAGLVHRDLHVGNILVSGGRYWLVDLHRAGFEPPSRYRAAEMLGFLLFSMSELVRLPERMRVLRAFAESDRVCEAAASWRDFVAEVRAAFLRVRFAYYEDRTSRVLGDSSSTTRLSSGDAFIVTAKGREVPPLEGELVKAVGRREVRRTPGGVAVKTTVRGFWRAIFEGLGRGAAVREWRNAWGMTFRRLPVPEPVALVSRRERQSYACRWIDGALPLNEHVARHGVSRDLVWRLARLVRKMHDRGAAHGDLKANNVLVRGDEIWFIDLDRVHFSVEASLIERLKNLAELNAALGAPVTIGDRMRFYRAYAGRDPEWQRLWKARVEEIMELTVERTHEWP